MKRLEEHSSTNSKQKPLFEQGRLIYSFAVSLTILLTSIVVHAAESATTQSAPPTTTSAPTEPDIADLILVITGEGDILSRKQAALKILQTHSEEGVEKLVRILARQNDQPAKLAICLAIADSRSQDPRFTRYLISFLKEKNPLQQAAAQALANYEDPKVQNQLSQYRQTQIISYLQICMNRLYQQTPAKARSGLLLEWLQSPLAVQRQTALEIMHQELTSRNAKPAEKVLAYVRSMINDRSPKVRRNLVAFLRDLRQLEDAPLLRKMLRNENSDSVRESIYHALGLLEDPASIPACTKGVRDPNENVAARAAGALGQLLELTNGADQKVLDEAAAALIERASQPLRNATLRENVIDALSKLGKPQALSVLKKHASNDEEVPAIRKAAVRGIGKVGDPQQLDFIFKRLSQDADPAVRETAAEVICKLASQPRHLDLLRQSMNPQKESSPAVREKAWIAYQTVYQKLTIPQQWQAISSWSVTAKENISRKIALLQKLEKRLANANGQQKTLLVDVQEALGGAWLAAGNTQKATDAWQKARINNPDQQIDREVRLAGKCVDAWLQSSSSPEKAVDFAATVKLPQVREAVAERLLSHLKKLSESNPATARQFAEMIKQNIPDQFGANWASRFQQQRQALQPSTQPATQPTTSTSPS